MKFWRQFYINNDEILSIDSTHIFDQNPRIKKIPLCLSGGGFSNNELAMTYSHMGNPTLPSALRGFTSEFGKGSGGSLLLWSPAQLFMDTC